MSYSLLVARNIFQQPFRTFFTAATLALTAFILALLVSIPSTLDRVIDTAASTLRLVSYNANGKFYGLPSRYCREIEQLPGVVGCDAVVVFPAIYQDSSEVFEASTLDVDKASVVFPDLHMSKELISALAKERQAGLVGEILLEKHHWRLGDKITLVADSGRLRLPVIIVGVIPAGRYPNRFVLRRDYLVEAEKRIGILENQHLPMALMTRTAPGANEASVIGEIEQHFRNSDYETSTMTESDATSSMVSSLGNIRAIVFSFVFIILTTMLAITVNSTSLSMRERVSQVVIMKAIGFSTRNVLRVLMGECGAVSIVGASVGAVLALALFRRGVSLAALNGPEGYFVVGLPAALSALSIVAGLGLLSGIISLGEVLKVPIAAALRRVV